VAVRGCRQRGRGETKAQEEANVRNYSPLKRPKPRRLTTLEIAEIEECWDLVSMAISEEIERQRLEDHQSK